MVIQAGTACLSGKATENELSAKAVNQVFAQLAAQVRFRPSLCGNSPSWYTSASQRRVELAGFIEGIDRGQTVLFPERLEDWIGEDNVVRVVDLFVDKLDLPGLGFVRSAPARTGRSGYDPAVLLKLFIHGYLNRVPSSRRLEREAGWNVEVMWLTCRLVPDHKTIADFRRDNGPGIRKTCAQFVELCRRIGTQKGDCVAIDGSKFKAVNNRDRNFTKGKIASRLAHLEADVERNITEMIRIDPMTLRRCTVEHTFGTIKAWMGATHFLMRRLKNVRTEMALNVLAYKIKRMIALIGIRRLMQAIPG